MPHTEATKTRAHASSPVATTRPRTQAQTPSPPLGQVALASTVERLSDELTALPDQAVLAVVQQALATRPLGVSHGSLSTMLRLALQSDEDIAALVGPPRVVHEHVNAAFVDLGIRVQAQRAVLDVPLLTSAAVAEALRAAGKNAREAASRLRRSGALLGVPRPGSRSIVYPAFQIDPVAAAVRPVVAEVNQALGAKDDPWAVASWWVTPSEDLDEDQAPMDLVGTERESDLLVMVDLQPSATASDVIAKPSTSR